MTFWARWRMSLSRWIRDYVFFPMVGRTATLPRLVFAAIGSMLLCGVWHGAGWTFVLWGAWHGVMVAGYHVFTAASRRGPQRPTSWPIQLLGMATTFALVMLGWVLFRSSDVSTAGVLLGRALWPAGGLHHSLPGTFFFQVAVVTACAWAAPSVTAGVDRIRPRVPIGLAALSRAVAWAALLSVSLNYLRGQTAFVYFQF